MAGCNQTSDADGDGLLAGEERAIRALDPPTPLRASNASLSTCTCEMQPWLENPVAFSGLMRRFPSDKATGAAAHGHDYQHMYYQHLPQIIRLKCRGSNEEERTLRIFEIGLGCGAGWERRSLGGSVGIWQALTPPGVKLDLHVMEFDANCARAWVKQRAGAAVMAADWRGSEFGSIGAEDSSAPVVMHTGDQNSTADLKRVFDEAGRQPFDVVIDDGSHLNEHQIGTRSCSPWQGRRSGCVTPACTSSRTSRALAAHGRRTQAKRTTAHLSVSMVRGVAWSRRRVAQPFSRA